jgi:hypothetical protein
MSWVELAYLPRDLVPLDSLCAPPPDLRGVNDLPRAVPDASSSSERSATEGEKLSRVPTFLNGAAPACGSES